MSDIITQALQEAVKSRDAEIATLEAKLQKARNGLFDAMVYINNTCKGVARQSEMSGLLNEIYLGTR